MQSDLTLLEQVKSGKIWGFPGGIHPPERKHLSNQTPIAQANLATHYYVPVKQHSGKEGEVLVKLGDKVLKGQPLTKPSTGLSLPVHAPTSGEVKEIKPHISAHASGAPELTLIIEADGKDDSVPAQPFNDWQAPETDALIEHIKSMGIAGLGGAAFPTYIKAHPAHDIELLIINAVECEPYITADDVLMRYHAEEIIEGVEILLHTTGAKLCLFAIEDNKPEAIEVIKKACEHKNNIDVRVVPTKYPSGGEKQLIQLLTSQQVPSKKLPIDLSIVMQNVGTAFAIKKAVIDGLPLTERVVTVTGESITNPQNLWTKLGTTVEDLVAQCGITAEKDQRLIMGGPMMGFNILDSQMPVVKATNCILAPSKYHVPPRGVEQACIRCGDCAAACPAELLPQQLLWYSKSQEHEKLEEYDLFDCIECGACAYVCPSQIPLVQYYRNSKAEIRQAEEDKAKAEKARIRFEQRQARLEREKQARLKRHQEAAERRRQALNQDDSAKDKIAAALARAKAKKQQQSEAPKETGKLEDTSTAVDNSTDAAPNQAIDPKDKVAAAIARAKAKKEQKAKQALDKSKSEQAPSAESKSSPTHEAQEQATDEKTPEQIKKERVAAAIAKAKAKKAKESSNENEQAAADKSTMTEESITDKQDVDASESQALKTPEQIKKEKVAAAIAKAKAKKQQAKHNADTLTEQGNE